MILLIMAFYWNSSMYDDYSDMGFHEKDYEIHFNLRQKSCFVGTLGASSYLTGVRDSVRMCGLGDDSRLTCLFLGDGHGVRDHLVGGGGEDGVHQEMCGE